MSDPLTPQNTFFNLDSVTLAQKLLGCILISESPEGKTAGIIVETEAYLFDDPASKSFKGKTRHNMPLFGPPGHTFIYMTYGKVHCLNITSGKEGTGEGVLIRALEPFEGIELMQKRRNKTEIKDLCSGPGKLTQALGLSLGDSNIKLGKGRIKLIIKKDKHIIFKTKRVGISKARDEFLRFYIQGNRFISRP